MPRERAAAMMWRRIAAPTPLRRIASAVCIDFTSPWSALSRLSAPTPASESPSQADQNVTSGDRSPERSSACELPGAVWNRIHFVVENLAAEVDRLRAAGVRFRSGIVTEPGGSQIVLDDPSGNPVELFQPARR